MKKQILTDRAEKKYLQKFFDCTNVMVWKALTFESDSDLARRIRKAALERGGQLSGAAIPECDTTFQTSEHTMTQTFGSRVKIVANTKNGLILVYVDDKLEREVSHLTVTEFMKLQKEVQFIASSL